MNYVFSYFHDLKIISWNRALRDSGFKNIKILGSPKSPLLFPFELILISIKKGLPKAVMFRYLNDSPSFFKTFFRMLSEMLTIFLCIIFNIKIYWLIHNVDRESTQYFPSISIFRRKFLNYFTDKVFVTHYFFKQYVEKKFNRPSHTIKVACFGSEDENNIKAINKNLLNKIDITEPNKHIGLWIGEFAEKKIIGLEFISKLILEDKNGLLKFLIIGINNNESYNFFVKKAGIDKKIYNKRIRCIGENIDIHSIFWPKYAHFVVRPMNDISLPLTYAYAAHVNLPIIGPDNNIVTKLAEYDSVGFGINFQKQPVNELIRYISRIDYNNFKKFQKGYNWLKGAKTIIKDIA